MKTYRISHISDLLKVPIERRKTCLREIECLLATADLVLGDDPPEKTFEFIDWTDDENPSVTIKDQSGKAYMTVQVEKGES